MADEVVLDAAQPMKELLTCLEVLMEDVDFHRDVEQWFELAEEIRHAVPAPKRPTPVEVTTAKWQTVELVMQLLQDHLALVQLFEQAAAEAEEREKVGEIIRPKLIVPGQA